MSERAEWPKHETCVQCRRFGPVWWWDTKPVGYVCAICADPQGYAEFRASLDGAMRRAEVRREREAKKMLRLAAGIII